MKNDLNKVTKIRKHQFAAYGMKLMVRKSCWRKTNSKTSDNFSSKFYLIHYSWGEYRSVTAFVKVCIG